MLAEWSAECSHDDPVLVVPWSMPERSVQESSGAEASFIDLRENPYDLDQIPEAERHPALLQALRALNAGRSPVFTAKCDAWPLNSDKDPDEIATLQLELDVPAEQYPAGFASYLDILWRERSVFCSFHQQEQLMHRLTRHAETLDLPTAALACVVRPALVDLTGPQEGFAVTLYVRALGADAATAYTRWAEALTAVTGLIRAKDLAFVSPAHPRTQPLQSK